MSINFKNNNSVNVSAIMFLNAKTTNYPFSVSRLYNMAPFSTSDRIRPGFNRRSREISKVTAEALESIVMVEMFPRSKIRVEIEILCAEAGTRCCGITAAAVALADAGIPMKDMLVSVAAGKINDIVVLDLDKAEDNYGQADLPVGILPNSKEIAFLQMDG